MTEIMFEVRGLPVPQGALVRSPAGGLYNRGADRLNAWRTAIAQEARDEMADAPCMSGPVAVHAEFRLPRPKGHYLPANGHRPAPELRLDAPTWHAGKPDADKLARSLLDALTGVVFGDDAQVASLTVWKTYDAPTGCVVRVTRLEATR